MKKNNIRGATFVEVISSTLILLFIFQIIFNLFIFQKKFSEENYLNGEYRRQLYFAESYLKRDFFESSSASKQGENSIVLTSHKGQLITYYLATDPYGEESWQGKSGKTLYRKISGENAQPLTQYCDGFYVNELLGEKRLKFKVEIRGGDKSLLIEEYYENK